MKKINRKILEISSIVFMLLIVSMSCSDGKDDPTSPEGPEVEVPEEDIAVRNLERAINLVDVSFKYYFVGERMALATSYNPFTQKRADSYTGIWEYTSAMESVNTVLCALKAHKEQGNDALYDAHYKRYSDLLLKLFDNLDYYRGTFRLTSFTQTKSWSVYAVSRSSIGGEANVEGKENVYDDQLWLIIELMRGFELTDDIRFLKEAEYLMQYVLDGWDATLDESGEEHGGIPWGHAYVTKHSASNGPAISPLVWLYEYYKERDDEITHRYIGEEKSRISIQMKKRDYYLLFAEKIYSWQKNNHLLSNGVYADMMGGCVDCNPKYEMVKGVLYRTHTPLKKAEGGEHSYNSGSMLMGACDLYRVTNKSEYLTDIKILSANSFDFFAKPVSEISGGYDFNDSKGTRVLLWGYLDSYPYNKTAETYIEPFQKLLDYAYKNHLKGGILPVDLYGGWKESDKNVNSIYEFSYVAEYALLSKFELLKNK